MAELPTSTILLYFVRVLHKNTTVRFIPIKYNFSKFWLRVLYVLYIVYECVCLRCIDIRRFLVYRYRVSKKFDHRENVQIQFICDYYVWYTACVRLYGQCITVPCGCVQTLCELTIIEPALCLLQQKNCVLSLVIFMSACV